LDIYNQVFYRLSEQDLCPFNHSPETASPHKTAVVDHQRAARKTKHNPATSEQTAAYGLALAQALRKNVVRIRQIQRQRGDPNNPMHPGLPSFNHELTDSSR
jgi:hypothetical protein